MLVDYYSTTRELASGSDIERTMGREDTRARRGTRLTDGSEGRAEVAKEEG